MNQEVFKVKGDPKDVQKMDLIDLVDEKRQTLLEMIHNVRANARV